MTARVGISVGDPNGIGPEVALRAVEEVRGQGSEVRFAVIGDRALVSSEAQRLGVACPEVLDPGVSFPSAQYGEISTEAGAASAAWVDAGIAACLTSELDALVTAPIHKHAWELAGIGFPGHTELLADRCKTNRFGMMLMGKGLRVMLATRHVPIVNVPEALTPDEIRLAVTLLQEGLPWMGVSTPRIAVCGLNPHAGDQGTIGREEVDWILPLVEELRSEGAPVTGPHPADTVFYEAVKGEHDAIVALYHDQGLGPLKLWAFDEGVNLTLGLPILRTSPDHGTAMGIAGKGVARPDSMICAVEAAIELTSRTNPWMLPPSS